MNTCQKWFSTLFSAIIIFVASTSNPVCGVTYTAIDLHPSGYDASEARVINGTQQVGWGWFMGTGSEHALLWNSSADNYIDLNPSGYTESSAYSISGSRQVGWAYNGNSIHAMLWNGSAQSCVDLHPSGFNESRAYSISNTQQVGCGMGKATGYHYHAFLWSSSPESFIDLHPNGFNESKANGISGPQQVGEGDSHALLWNGSAESFVDLNPSAFKWSGALGTNGEQQVGWGYPMTDNYSHALLWNGSAQSYVDLHPSGFNESRAYGISNTQQVGWAYNGNTIHAILWNGSAESYIDLHQFLPAGFSKSYAKGIDDYGNIVGNAIDSSGKSHAILWQQVPDLTLIVTLDIKPTSCPNPLNVKSKGVLPIAILGTEELDVSMIDPASIFLNGVPAIRSNLEDVSTPLPDPNECECSEAGPDGIIDLTLKFDTQQIVETLGEVNRNDIITLPLTGVLYDGNPIEGQDCIIIKGRHKPINIADVNKDGVVNVLDMTIFAQNWLESSVVE